MQTNKIYLVISSFIVSMSVGFAADVSLNNQDNLVIAKTYKNTPLTTTGKKYRRPRNTNKNNFTNFKYKPPTDRKRMTNPAQNKDRDPNQ